MCGVTSTMFSPSRVSASLSTPCVDGCCGPMLISIISVRNILAPRRASAASGSAQPDVLVRESLERILLAQRVPLPVVGQQDAPQVGMARERDAEQVEHFSLVPFRRTMDSGYGGDRL